MNQSHSEKKPNIILNECEDILKLKGKQYGDYVELFDRMAERFSFTLGEYVTPVRAAMIMVELKLARMDLNLPCHDDFQDAINYLAIAGSLQSRVEVINKTPRPEIKGNYKDIDWQDILKKKPE